MDSAAERKESEPIPTSPASARLNFRLPYNYCVQIEMSFRYRILHLLRSPFIRARPSSPSTPFILEPDLFCLDFNHFNTQLAS
jgi:hypothetical protein